MRILLDESLPRPLARLLQEHDVRTVAAMGWTGKRYGELLQLAAGDFDAVLTADQGLEHQQNLATLPVAVVVLHQPELHRGRGVVCRFEDSSFKTV